MTLFATTNSGTVYEVHIGGNILSRIPNEYSVVEIYADGDELEYIRKNFSGIRMAAGRHVVWTGADATFIANNFVSYNPRYSPIKSFERGGY